MPKTTTAKEITKEKNKELYLVVSKNKFATSTRAASINDEDRNGWNSKDRYYMQQHQDTDIRIEFISEFKEEAKYMYENIYKNDRHRYSYILKASRAKI